MKLRDIWGRATSPLRKITSKGIQQQAVERRERVEHREEVRQDAQAKVRDLTRYRWVTLGLNRKEKRAYRAMIVRAKRGAIDARDSAGEKITPARVKFLQFLLKGSPKNHQAVHNQTNNPLYWRGVRTPANVG
jgi:hypothetical protein